MTKHKSSGYSQERDSSDATPQVEPDSAGVPAKAENAVDPAGRDTDPVTSSKDSAALDVRSAPKAEQDSRKTADSGADSCAKGAVKWHGFVWSTVKSLLAVFLGVATLVFAVIFGITVYRSYFSVPESVEVPAIQGKDLSQANKMLKDLGLRLRIDEGRYSNKFPERIIISQELPAGKQVRRDREIVAVVSLGPEQILVPNLKGKSLREAKLILANDKLTLGNVTPVSEDRERPDEVVSQKPAAGAGVSRGTKVSLDVNKGFGMASVVVPDWTGKNVVTARALLDKVGLKMGRISWSTSSESAQGVIIGQTPPVGAQVLTGSEVEFEVSAGALGNRMFVQRHLVLTLPAGSDSHAVRVMLVSSNGEEVVYQGNHVVGDELDMWVSGPRSSDVEVYINDKLYSRDIL